MTAVYFDASAVVKLLLPEDDRTLALTLWEAGTASLASTLTLAEVHAAVSAAVRSRRIVGGVDALHDAIDDLWSRLWVIPLDDTIARAAGRLSRRHHLSGADAVHLASAIAVAPVLMVTWDQRLAAAALAEGLSVAPSP